MKIIIKIFNVIAIIGLILQFLSIISNHGYSETIGVAPIFVSDVILIIIVSIGPIAIIYLSFGNRFVISAIFLIISLISAGLAYLSYPSVRMENAQRNLFDVELAIENLQSNRDHYRANNAIDYYKLRMEELELFRSTYRRQFDFLLISDAQNDARRDRLTYFFGILALVLMVNSYTTYQKIEREE